MSQDSRVLYVFYIWLVVSTYTSEKYEFVSWDDEFTIYGKIKSVSNQQPVYVFYQSVFWD